jgi:hypothetical protein
MDQLCYLTHKATEAIEHDDIYLNNATWFPNTMPHVPEFEEMLEEEEKYEDLLFENEADNIDEISDNEDEVQEEKPEYIGEILLKFWKKRYKALASDFAICGWYLCIGPEVMGGVRGNYRE